MNNFEFGRWDLETAVNMMMEEYVQTIEAKKALYMTAYENAKTCIEENGLDITEFSINRGSYKLFGKPFEEMMEEGLNFIIIDNFPETDVENYERRNREYLYRVLCYVGMTGMNDQLMVSAHLQRISRFGVEETLIDGTWTRHYSFEDNGELQNCDKCPSRYGCANYRMMIEAEMLAEEEDDDEESFDVIPDIVDIYNDLTTYQKNVYDNGGSKARLLETYVRSHGPISDKEWRSLCREYEKLLQTYDISGNLLDFSEDHDANPILVPSDSDHIGVCVKVNNNKLQLCQYIDNYMREETVDFDKFCTDNADYIYSVAEVKTPAEIMQFIKKHIDRSTRNGTIYTIPLSLNKAVYLYGAISQKVQNTKKTVQKVLEKGSTEEEKKAAESWLKEFDKIGDLLA